MPPVVVDHIAAAADTKQQLTAGSSTTTAADLVFEKEHQHQVGRFGSSSSTTTAATDDDDDTFDDDVDEDTSSDDNNDNDNNAAVIPRTRETNSNSSMVIRRSSNLFLEDDDFNIGADLNSSALATSFDALEDIDLMSSPLPPRQEQFQQLEQSTGATKLLSSTYEELARQLQAEDVEAARKQRQAANSQKQKGSMPTRKLKKSWLDNLIGEPFPQEMRRNYARADCQSNCRSGLMAAIAAADAIESSILVADNQHNSSRNSNNNSSTSNLVDEGINQLSTSISKWWGSKVRNNIQNNNSSSSTAAPDDPPRFIDNGTEGIYHGDLLTDNNNDVIQPLQRHGHGTMTYKSGDTFSGNFERNNFHGWGIYIWSDGDKQRGTWVNGLRHGPCVFHHAASDVVEYGYYHEGKVVGEGVRLNAERTVAWKLVDGKKLEGTIDMEEAEKIVAKRFDCFPIPVGVNKKNRRTSCE